MASHLLLQLLEHLGYNFRIGAVGGCHFGEHFLQKVQAYFIQNLIPVMVPIVILYVLAFLGLSHCFLPQTFVQFLEGPAVENLKEAVSHEDDAM